MSQTIAVTGATGQLGRIVIAALKARLPASKIVALARDPAKAEDLGVAVRPFNYNKPDAAALQGVEKLLLISGSEVGQREPQHKAVIAAAKEAGVKFIAYTSLLRADTSSLDLAVEHKATEEAIKASGLPFAILRNSWYTENYAGSIAAALAHGALVGSAGAGKISAAARTDYAEAAAIVLTTEGHRGKIYELAGDTAFTLSELAEEISRQSGKQISYHDMPVSEYAKILEGAGLPSPVAAMIAVWEGPISQGALFDGSRTLSKLISRPTTPISVLVAALLKG